MLQCYRCRCRRRRRRCVNCGCCSCGGGYVGRRRLSVFAAHHRADCLHCATAAPPQSNSQKINCIVSRPVETNEHVRARAPACNRAPLTWRQTTTKRISEKRQAKTNKKNVGASTTLFFCAKKLKTFVSQPLEKLAKTIAIATSARARGRETRSHLSQCSLAQRVYSPRAHARLRALASHAGGGVERRTATKAIGRWRARARRPSRRRQQRRQRRAVMFFFLLLSSEQRSARASTRTRRAHARASARARALQRRRQVQVSRSRPRARLRIQRARSRHSQPPPPPPPPPPPLPPLTARCVRACARARDCKRAHSSSSSSERRVQSARV